MIISNSMLNVAAFRAFVLLLLDEVLPDERLVLDENDEPSEMNEFGRCTAAFELSAAVVENELRNLGAVTNKRFYFIVFFFHISLICRCSHSCGFWFFSYFQISPFSS